MHIKQPFVGRKASWSTDKITEATTLDELGPWNLSSLFARVLKWYWVKRGRQQGRLLVEKIALSKYMLDTVIKNHL